MERISNKEVRALARAISLIESGHQQGYDLLASLRSNTKAKVLGFTGPPGAGKSTLINAFAQFLVDQGKQVAIIAVDPTSPFTKGSLLGDRIRMSQLFLHPSVFIRSMAGRGSLGGLSPKIFEVVDLLKSAWFDYILIETVGVGQSEVEIAGLADTTVLVLVPEAGDEIQTIKSGVMEIADIYVVNKSDRDGAATFYKNLVSLVHAQDHLKGNDRVVKAIASKNEGIKELYHAISSFEQSEEHQLKKNYILTEKAMKLIKEFRTKDISEADLAEQLKLKASAPHFNLYQFVLQYLAN